MPTLAHPSRSALPARVRLAAAGVVAMALAAGASVAGAEEAPVGEPRGAPAPPVAVAPSTDDHRFVREAVEANQLQVVLARLALDHGASAVARRAAQELLADHERADDALQELAARKGISLSDAPGTEPAPNDRAPRATDEPATPASPVDLRPANAKAYEALASLTGGELDASFARTLVSELERSRAAFERAAREARDPEIKGYAASTLPAIEDQLRRARELRHAVDADRGAATPGAPAGATSQR